VVTVLAVLSLSCGSQTDPSRPNVVLVVVDTLRADRLPEYGHARPTSGALASFLADATRFDRAYTPGSWTRPAVASVLTGLVPARHLSKGGHSERLPEVAVSLVEELAAAGWTTMGFSHNISVSGKNDFDQGFERFEAYDGGVLEYPHAHEMIDAALDVVVDSRRPFLLYLQPMNPHGPYRVPPDRRSTLLGRPPIPGFVYQSPGFQMLMLGRLELRADVTSELLTSLEEQYDTAVRYTLDEVSRLFEALQAAGEYESSWIVVTSDHGEELFDHGGFSHGYTLHEEVVRVPLFIKPAGAEPPGGVIEQAVGLVDLHPTLLAAAGLRPAPDLDGRSLLPLLRPGVPRVESPPRELLLEGDVDRRCRARGLLRGRYKLIHVDQDYEGRRDEILLFDLEEDPRERENLASERPELAAELMARLEELFAEAEARALPVAEQRPVEIDRRTLEALGYLDRGSGTE
jgi:arylsulfatase A-like enzyme